MTALPKIPRPKALLALATLIVFGGCAKGEAVNNEDIVDTWKSGNAVVTLSRGGALRVGGAGAMRNYNPDTIPPWHKAAPSITNLTIEGVDRIGNYAFHGLTALTSVTIQNGVSNIGAGAFSSCSSLTSVTIPASVVNIGVAAFGRCTGLTSLTISNGVQIIEQAAFSRCSSLTAVTIPASVTHIGGAAFHDCSSLTSVTFEGILTHIGAAVFGNCPRLASIISQSPVQPGVDSVVFGSHYESACLYVPKGRISAYKSNRGWGSWRGKFKHIKVIEPAPPETGAAGKQVRAADTQKTAANTLTDLRDGKVYRTAKIGNFTWMAEDLNYAAEKSWCYGGDDGGCEKYGRVYAWNAAMRACPEGWWLPSASDWDNMGRSAGGKWTRFVGKGPVSYWDGVGKKLKSKTGWGKNWNGRSGNGADEFGFSAMPNASFSPGRHLVWLDTTAGYWWTSTEYSDEHAWFSKISGDALYTDGIKKNFGYAVRCVQGGDTTETEYIAKKPADCAPVIDTNAVSKHKHKWSIGTFTDKRNQRSYRTVKIGGKTWMAENLQFKTNSSRCYNDADSNCIRYGQLYNWSDAMYNACPATWRLPGDDDWNKLLLTAGGWKAAGKKLKSVTGWSDCSDFDEDEIEDILDGGTAGKTSKSKTGLNARKGRGNGTDEFGFSALPGGYSYNGAFHSAGKKGYWWAAASDFNPDPFVWWVSSGFDGMDRNRWDKKGLYSVRCLQDSAAVR